MTSDRRGDGTLRWPGPHHPHHHRRSAHRRHGGDARWWRRRFLRFFILVGLVWVVLGIAFGAGRRNDGPDEQGGRSGPPAVLFVGVAGALFATFVAYRRFARPMSDLLAGAERIGAGEYDARVDASGPRAVRTLGHAFNDMAGRLDDSEEARRRFLADVTHELRTPLTVLQGEIEAQLDGVHPRDDTHLETLLDQTRTLDRLVEDLRTLSLGDAGRLVLHCESISLRALVEDAVAAIAPLARREGVTIGLDGDADPQELDADRVRLGQVLANVLTNAVRHTPDGGSVTVATGRQTELVTVTIDDDGPGIAGDPERVFDRFARATDSGGSGLGLTIARQLVEAHSGTITAGRAPSGGARFTIGLPSPAGSADS